MTKWQDVPYLVTSLIKEGSTIFNRIRVAVKQLPKATDYGIWFNPKSQAIYFTLGNGHDDDVVADWMDGLQVKGVRKVTYKDSDSSPNDSGPWIRVKEAAISSIVKPLAWLGGWTPGGTAELFGGPNPLSATIASGALGAGAGYLGGTVLEHLIPQSIADRGYLRRTLATLGGIGGAIPGAMIGMGNARNHGLSGWLKSPGAAPPTGVEDSAMKPQDFGPAQSHVLDTSPEHTASSLQLINDFLDVLTEAVPLQKRESEKLADAFMDSGYFSANPGNAGLYGGSSSGQGLYVKTIDKDRFNRAVWDDPYLPDVYKGMTSGVVEGASQMDPNATSMSGSPLVSPMDIANVGIGMGSGWAVGTLVGKTLGGLAGLSDTAQKSLQRAGIFAGLIKGTVPKLF
jgi:hypothetical protein